MAYLIAIIVASVSTIYGKSAQNRFTKQYIGTWWQIVYCNLPLIDLGASDEISTSMGSGVSV